MDIQSKEVIDKISDELKLQPSLDIPREIAKQIQLSYNVNPFQMIRVKTADASDDTNQTIHTCHATKKTFFVGANLSVAKDVVSDSIRSNIRITPASTNVSIQFLRIRYEPLTAASNLAQQSFLFFPIELVKGSIIQVENQSATASIDASGVIFFYETDPQ